MGVEKVSKKDEERKIAKAIFPLRHMDRLRPGNHPCQMPIAKCRISMVNGYSFVLYQMPGVTYFPVVSPRRFG